MAPLEKDSYEMLRKTKPLCLQIPLVIQLIFFHQKPLNENLGIIKCNSEKHLNTIVLCCLLASICLKWRSQLL